MIACPSCGRDNVGVQHARRGGRGAARAPTRSVRGRGARLRRERAGRGGRRRLRHRRRPRRRLHLRARPRAARRCRVDILVDELFHEIDQWIAAGMHRPKRLQDGEAGRARDGRGVGDPARTDPHVVHRPVAWDGNDDRPRLTSSSCRPCATRRPTPRRSATSCSCAAASSARSARRLWTFLPLGWRVHRKVEQIIREEMDAIGGAGDADARADAGRALGGDRPRQDPGDLPPQGPRRAPSTSCR